MHWLLDGYNVIRRNPELSATEDEEGLGAGRQALFNLLANAAQRSRHRFTVVFDGAKGGSRAVGGVGVEVIFSGSTGNADKLLIERATPNVTVVSDDREVTDGARRAGTRPAPLMNNPG
jgi:predicted RNA-binding protein with PIN domain